MILNFSTADFDHREYFIYSSLLSDTGIDCPDDNIAHLCLLVNKPDLLLMELKKLSLGELIKSYNFFDQYCTSKGILYMFKSMIKRSTKIVHYIPCCKTFHYMINGQINTINIDTPLNVMSESRIMYFDGPWRTTYRLQNSRHVGNSILFDAELEVFNAHGSDTYEACGIIYINTFEGRIVSIKTDNNEFIITAWH